MKHVVIVCDLITTDEFDQEEIKKMFDATSTVKHASMQIKITPIKGGDSDGLQHPDKRW